MTPREALLKQLEHVPALIKARPHWQRGLLDEFHKSTSDTPRPVVIRGQS